MLHPLGRASVTEHPHLKTRNGELLSASYFEVDFGVGNVDLDAQCFSH